jgi:hypothetical protein
MTLTGIVQRRNPANDNGLPGGGKNNAAGDS